MTGDTPRCRSCMAVLRFILMESGRSMPVEPVRVPDGSVVARWDGRRYVDGFVLSARRTDVPEGWFRFQPHWVDCEHARRQHLEADVKAPTPRTDFLV